MIQKTMIRLEAVVKTVTAAIAIVEATIAIPEQRRVGDEHRTRRA